MIALDVAGGPTPVPAAVRFTTAVYGVHRPGTAYRMDEVPIPLRVLLESDDPCDGDVLTAMLYRLISCPPYFSKKMTCCQGSVFDGLDVLESR